MFATVSIPRSRTVPIYRVDLTKSEAGIDLRRLHIGKSDDVIGDDLDVTLQKMPISVKPSISGMKYEPSRVGGRSNSYTKLQLKEWTDKLSKGLFSSIKRKDNQMWLLSFNEMQMELNGVEWINKINASLEWN